jgi:hypothetical protein
MLAWYQRWPAWEAELVTTEMSHSSATPASVALLTTGYLSGGIFVGMALLSLGTPG